MSKFPPPDATYSEVQAWYKANAPEPAYIRFSGQNCVKLCAGWDGESQRCQCGNRRVYWDTSGGTPFARAD